MNLPESVLTALNRLEKSGHSAYVVGGSVRDALLGHIPNDYDICTSARAAQIREVFSDCKTIDIGAKFGTIKVFIDGLAIEITTYRRELGYTDSRHPDSVVFSDDVSDDLSRRDFTANAVAYNPECGYVDPFGGIRDIKRHVLRAVGNPTERFFEDALRIMRAARFCATLGFSMEPKTRSAAIYARNSLKNISAERIRDELSKFIVTKKAGDRLREYKQIFFVIIPELALCDGFAQNNPNHCFDVFGHICETVNRVAPTLLLRLTALLHDIAKPDCYSYTDGRGRFLGHMEKSASLTHDILTRLRYPGVLVARVTKLVNDHDRPYDSSPETARYWLGKMGREDIFNLLKLKRADCLAHDKSYHNRLRNLTAFDKAIRKVLFSNECYKLPMLALNGDDLLLMCKKDGRLVGETLEYLLSEVIHSRAANDKETLLRLAEKYISKGN
ncbi:MAG: CCA tRNA nucleotidyltransferase [Oscillospiraceae bacterium]